MATATEILAAVDNAILVTITGNYSEYTIAGRSLSKLDLGELRRMRREYAALERNESSVGGMTVRRGIYCDD